MFEKILSDLNNFSKELNSSNISFGRLDFIRGQVEEHKRKLQEILAENQSNEDALAEGQKLNEKIEEIEVKLFIHISHHQLDYIESVINDDSMIQDEDNIKKELIELKNDLEQKFSRVEGKIKEKIEPLLDRTVTLIGRHKREKEYRQSRKLGEINRIFRENGIPVSEPIDEKNFSKTKKDILAEQEPEEFIFEKILDGISQELNSSNVSFERLNVIKVDVEKHKEKLKEVLAENQSDKDVLAEGQKLNEKIEEIEQELFYLHSLHQLNIIESQINNSPESNADGEGNIRSKIGTKLDKLNNVFNERIRFGVKEDILPKIKLLLERTKQLLGQYEEISEVKKAYDGIMNSPSNSSEEKAEEKTEEKAEEKTEEKSEEKTVDDKNHHISRETKEKENYEGEIEKIDKCVKRIDLLKKTFLGGSVVSNRMVSLEKMRQTLLEKKVEIEEKIKNIKESLNEEEKSLADLQELTKELGIEEKTSHLEQQFDLIGDIFSTLEKNSKGKVEDNVDGNIEGNVVAVIKAKEALDEFRILVSVYKASLKEIANKFSLKFPILVKTWEWELLSSREDDREKDLSERYDKILEERLNAMDAESKTMKEKEEGEKESTESEGHVGDGINLNNLKLKLEEELKRLEGFYEKVEVGVVVDSKLVGKIQKIRDSIEHVEDEIKLNNLKLKLFKLEKQLKRLEGLCEKVKGVEGVDSRLVGKIEEIRNSIQESIDGLHEKIAHAKQKESKQPEEKAGKNPWGSYFSPGEIKKLTDSAKKQGVRLIEIQEKLLKMLKKEDFLDLKKVQKKINNLVAFVGHYRKENSEAQELIGNIPQSDLADLRKLLGVNAGILKKIDDKSIELQEAINRVKNKTSPKKENVEQNNNDDEKIVTAAQEIKKSGSAINNEEILQLIKDTEKRLDDAEKSVKNIGDILKSEDPKKELQRKELVEQGILLNESLDGLLALKKISSGDEEFLSNQGLYAETDKIAKFAGRMPALDKNVIDLYFIHTEEITQKLREISNQIEASTPNEKTSKKKEFISIVTRQKEILDVFESAVSGLPESIQAVSSLGKNKKTLELEVREAKRLALSLLEKLNKTIGSAKKEIKEDSLAFQMLEAEGMQVQNGKVSNITEESQLEEKVQGSVKPEVSLKAPDIKTSPLSPQEKWKQKVLAFLGKNDKENLAGEFFKNKEEEYLHFKEQFIKSRVKFENSELGKNIKTDVDKVDGLVREANAIFEPVDLSNSNAESSQLIARLNLVALRLKGFEQRIDDDLDIIGAIASDNKNGVSDAAVSQPTRPVVLKLENSRIGRFNEKSASPEFDKRLESISERLKKINEELKSKPTHKIDFLIEKDEIIKKCNEELLNLKKEYISQDKVGKVEELATQVKKELTKKVVVRVKMVKDAVDAMILDSNSIVDRIKKTPSDPLIFAKHESEITLRLVAYKTAIDELEKDVEGLKYFDPSLPEKIEKLRSCLAQLHNLQAKKRKDMLDEFEKREKLAVELEELSYESYIGKVNAVLEPLRRIGFILDEGIKIEEKEQERLDIEVENFKGKLIDLQVASPLPDVVDEKSEKRKAIDELHSDCKAQIAQVSSNILGRYKDHLEYIRKGLSDFSHADLDKHVKYLKKLERSLYDISEITLNFTLEGTENLSARYVSLQSERARVLELVSGLRNKTEEKSKPKIEQETKEKIEPETEPKIEQETGENTKPNQEEGSEIVNLPSGNSAKRTGVVELHSYQPPSPPPASSAASKSSYIRKTSLDAGVSVNGTDINLRRQEAREAVKKAKYIVDWGVPTDDSKPAKVTINGKESIEIRDKSISITDSSNMKACEEMVKILVLAIKANLDKGVELGNLQLHLWGDKDVVRRAAKPLEDLVKQKLTIVWSEKKDEKEENMENLFDQDDHGHSP